MKIINCENYDEMSKKAAELVAKQIKRKPNSILGLATGSTPIGMYKKLVEMNKNGEIDFSEITSFNLDEYYPISHDDKNSYYSFMRDNLFSQINIKSENTYIPNGETITPVEECCGYEELICQKGGIDLQILGVGENGHIGFNEPDEELYANTHLTKLTKSTVEANSRFFKSKKEVPKHALTMGISTIMKAEKIILLASGKSKSEALSKLLEQHITTRWPVTMLQAHKDVVLICDKDAYTK